jgi:hypothetical protein
MRDPAEPAQDLGHVRSEHTAVGVALIDDYERKPPEEAIPAGVPRQQRVVQHVRRGEQVVRVRPGPGSVGEGGIAVHDGGTDARDGQRGHHPQLVGGQRPGRRQVQRGAAVQDPGQGRQEVAERLSGCGRRRDDHVLAPGRVVGRGGLVRPGPGDPGRLERLGDLGGSPVGPVDAVTVGGGDLLQVGKPPRPRARSEDPAGARWDRQLISGEQRHRRHRLSVCHDRGGVPRTPIWYRHDVRA